MYPFQATSRGVVASALDLDAQRTTGMGRVELVPARSTEEYSPLQLQRTVLVGDYQFDYHRIGLW